MQPRSRKVGELTSRLLDFWAPQLLDFSTSRLLDFWTPQLLDFSTSRLLDFSTPQLLNSPLPFGTDCE
jgi:hypothetical protein